MTASERAAQINAVSATRELAEGWLAWTLLEEDPAYWAEYGVHTGEDLDAYLAFETYVDVYKDVNNIKPRWLDWRPRSAQGWREAYESLESL